MAPTMVVRAVLALTALLPIGGILFVQLLLLASLRLGAVATPVAKFPAVVTFVTAQTPAGRLHGRASTDNGLHAIGVGAGQVVDEDVVSRPTDTLHIEVAIAVTFVVDLSLIHI